MRFGKIFLALLVSMIFGGKAIAMPAPDANSALILDTTVSGCPGGSEWTKATALGFTPVCVDAATWSAMTTAEFKTYRQLDLGDATCTSVTAAAAAEANRATWSAAVDGNIILVGTDPVFHSSFGPGGPQGGDQVVENAIAFAGDEPTKTGLYISLSCYYHGVASSTPVPLLDQFGPFTVTGVGCYNDAHIVAVHPALIGLTDASLSGWGCSVHEAFDSFPADFLPLVIAQGIAGAGSMTFPDGTFGIPYILARGEKLSPILCGNNILEAGEECDDGNTNNGDGCSAQCKIEIPISFCGDGTVDAGEQCDDGNMVTGDGCSATCVTEYCGDGIMQAGLGEECDDGNTNNGDGCTDSCLINNAPDCSTAAPSVAVIWPPNHKGVAISIIGVSDPDGDPLMVSATSVYQDEVVQGNGEGSGNTLPDASLSPLQIRAERNGNKKTPGNGRVYHISFTADDGAGGECSGTVRVCVPHDQGGSSTCIDGGPLYDSTQP
jgi:cysteine-rich repeat protein